MISVTFFASLSFPQPPDPSQIPEPQIAFALHAQWDPDLTDNNPSVCTNSGTVAVPWFHFYAGWKEGAPAFFSVDWVLIEELTSDHEPQVWLFSPQGSSGFPYGCTMPPVSDPENWNWTTWSFAPMIGFAMHNTSYRITVQWRYSVYMKGPRGPFQTSITINVQNLVVTSSDETKVLKWDPVRGIADTTFSYSLECAQRKWCQVKVSIYSTDGMKVYEEWLEQIAPGSYSFVWDGSVNVVPPPPPPDGKAPAGLYVFDIDVIGIAPGYDEDWLRSRWLTIDNVTVAGLPVDAKDYVKVRVGYTLSDIVPPVLCKIEVWGYVFDSALNKWYWAKLGEENAPTNLGANIKDLTLLRSAIASVGGLIYFIIHALDDHSESYKNHQRKWALPKGRAIYHKILDVPHYNQETEVWCGEATAKMWIDYKSANNPTQKEIAQWVLLTFGPQGAEDRNGNRVIDPEERAIWPLEYGSVLNHFIPANKYHRYVSASQDEIIGREAHLIAEYHEPSAAVTEMEPPDVPNDPSDRAWHWLLVVDALLMVGLVQEVLMSLGYGFMTLGCGSPSFQRMFPQIFGSKNILSGILIVTERVVTCM